MRKLLIVALIITSFGMIGCNKKQNNVVSDYNQTTANTFQTQKVYLNNISFELSTGWQINDWALGIVVATPSNASKDLITNILVSVSDSNKSYGTTDELLEDVKASMNSIDNLSNMVHTVETHGDFQYIKIEFDCTKEGIATHQIAYVPFISQYLIIITSTDTGEKITPSIVDTLTKITDTLKVNNY